MERIRRRKEAESINEVISLLPIKVQDLIRPVHFVTEYDPSFIGLHFYKITTDGRHYDSTSHCVWHMHQKHIARRHRMTTVVLQDGDAYSPDVIVHELGHVIEEKLKFDIPKFKPINSYAATDESEAFACAFQAWTNPTRYTDHWRRHNIEDLYKCDPSAVAFFNNLFGEYHNLAGIYSAIGED